MSANKAPDMTFSQKFEDLKNDVNRLRALLEVTIEVATRLDRLIKAVKLDPMKYLGDVDLCLEVAKGVSKKERSTINLTAPAYNDLVENIVVKTMTLATEQPDSTAESVAFMNLLQTELDDLLAQISRDRAAFRSQLGLLQIVHQFHVTLAPDVREFSGIPVGDLQAAKMYLDTHPEILTSKAQAALVSSAYEAELLEDSRSVACIAQAVSVSAAYAEDKMKQLLADSALVKLGDITKRYQIEYKFFVGHVKSRCAALKQEISVGGATTSVAAKNLT